MARRSEAELLAFHEEQAKKIRERLEHRKRKTTDKRYMALQRGIDAIYKVQLYNQLWDQHGTEVLEKAKQALYTAQIELKDVGDEVKP
jgi:hypothetical protein